MLRRVPPPEVPTKQSGIGPSPQVNRPGHAGPDLRDKKEVPLALEDKFDDIKKLIDVGKEKGYLTYSEVNDLIPQDVQSPDDLDDLLTTIGTQGIDILEGPAKERKFADEEAGADVELARPPVALEKRASAE